MTTSPDQQTDKPEDDLTKKEEIVHIGNFTVGKYSQSL